MNKLLYPLIIINQYINMILINYDFVGYCSHQ